MIFYNIAVTWHNVSQWHVMKKPGAKAQDFLKEGAGLLGDRPAKALSFSYKYKKHISWFGHPMLGRSKSKSILS